VRARMLIDARNEADTVLRATEKALDQGADLLAAEEADRIRTAAAELREARGGDDVDRTRTATDRLNQETQHLAELLMDSALREALRNRRVTETRTR
jgi:molecular chaperone HscA